MKSILLVSHGSHCSETKIEIEHLLVKLKEKIDTPIVEYAFLEVASPNIPEGIQNCLEKGAKEVLILLNFLNSGRHVNFDIPEIIDAFQKNSPDIKIKISKPLSQSPKIVDLFLDNIKSCDAE